MQNGRIVQSEVVELDFSMEEYDVIPLQPDNRKYNRAKVKKETEREIERYERGEDDGR